MLVTFLLLAHPDFTKLFMLDTDVSSHAIGAVLSKSLGSSCFLTTIFLLFAILFLSFCWTDKHEQTV